MKLLSDVEVKMGATVQLMSHLVLLLNVFVGFVRIDQSTSSSIYKHGNQNLQYETHSGYTGLTR
ncbi:hypothetical protein DPMN_188647 [Dreissena polymorpha]|uniref:Uncharacterized protein n=1 Tax=Dreissena polymorpha TaxID=45954 RepID=A0A9D4DST7_DREPO|nr:hypothetical protein DPMN_188647 [Dreissena polymorpha]